MDADPSNECLKLKFKICRVDHLTVPGGRIYPPAS
ncbi:hypothetical protein Toce_0856 [Thermosediminibacter oceani DSM 16646]|uniref:Uncharacterized protein n=1 Tax=Thermosediminibacter oceani (strain ATCC BAA-1034 / DSM 16646 / JW/IW-1228P) TaxID=555079 RepID=D9S2J1_THEOJ|nr:hypothetical protein Toce_0856 [Thermosediminibacter oceani DSM 16646]